MTREEFKKLVAGHFALMNGTEKDALSKYVEGGLFAYDHLIKKQKDMTTEGQNDPKSNAEIESAKQYN